MNILKGDFKKGSVLKHVTLDGVRLHLKTDERKLWINGYYVLFLNETANYILEKFIDSCYEVPKEEVIERTLKKLKKKYWFTGREHLRKDLHQLIGIINSFSRNEIPTNLVGMKYISDEKKTAPNRMDISLTYDCNNNCAHCYLPEGVSSRDYHKKELTTEEWKTAIVKLWRVGIPQIVFTGGECTLKKDLVELVSFSKKFVTGIISNGTNITYELARDLKKAELDWIQITLESHKRLVHDKMQGRSGSWVETMRGINYCIKAGIQTSINLTITQQNKKDLKGIIDLAKNYDIPIVSANAIINSGGGIKQKGKVGISEEELKDLLIDINKYAKKKGIQFNWFLPTCYKNLDPVKLGFGQRCCSACNINMMIEPTGDVIPCQSWTELKLGNILRDDWNLIWNNSFSKKIRAFGYAPKKCDGCSHFELCGGACPLEHINGAGCAR
jgi:radical SAM protein with 4Fe4S-binding SPASM domain